MNTLTTSRLFTKLQNGEISYYKKIYTPDNFKYWVKDFLRDQLKDYANYRNNFGSATVDGTDYPMNVARKKCGLEIAKVLKQVKNQDHRTLESKPELVATYLIALESLADEFRYIHNVREAIQNLEPNLFDSTYYKDWQFIDLTDEKYNLDGIQRQNFTRLNTLFKLHFSVTDVGSIAYYPSLKHFREKREVRTRLGKFLSRFKNELGLTESDLKNVVDVFNAEMVKLQKLEFKLIQGRIEDRQEWRDVYYNREYVGSCMGGKSCIEVYCSDLNEFRLAVIFDEDKKVRARAVVANTENKKGYIRTYPSPQESSYAKILISNLEQEGYESINSLEGLHLEAQETDYSSDDYIAPYIDGDSQSADLVTLDSKEYLEISDYGQFSLTSTNGTTLSTICGHCDEHCSEDEITEVNGDYICESCRDNNYCWSDWHEEYIYQDNAVWIESHNDYFYYDSDQIFHDGNEYHHIEHGFYDEFKEAYVLDSNIAQPDLYFDYSGNLKDGYDMNCDVNDIVVLPCGSFVNVHDKQKFLDKLNNNL